MRMNRWTAFVVATIASLSLIVGANIAHGQVWGQSTARPQVDMSYYPVGTVWSNGRTYHRRQCNNPGCQMCYQIQMGLWAANRPRATITASDLELRKSLTSPSMSVVVPVKTETTKATTTTTGATTTVRELQTVTEQVPYQVKMCSGGRCWYETRYRTQTRQVWRTVTKPVAAKKAEAPVTREKPKKAEKEETPAEGKTLGEIQDEILSRSASEKEGYSTMKQVKETLAILGLLPNSLMLEVGAGDGRACVEAVRLYGCKVLGVEIIPERAAEARRAVLKAERDGTIPEGRITIVTADIMDLDPDLYRDATHGMAYLFEEDLETIKPVVRRIPKFATLLHGVPGMQHADFRGGVDGPVYLYENENEPSVVGGPELPRVRIAR